jgi:hypothetical protein
MEIINIDRERLAFKREKIAELAKKKKKKKKNPETNLFFVVNDGNV